MKIVFLNPLSELGGAEKSLLDLMASLRALKPEWSLYLIIVSPGPLALQATELGINTVVVPMPRTLTQLGDAGAGGTAGAQINRLRLGIKLICALLPLTLYLWRLRRGLTKIDPDVIHSNGFKMHLFGAWASPQKIPIIWHIRDYVSSRPLMARLLRLNQNRCTLAIANSQSVAADIRQACGVGLAVQTVYNGIDLSIFTPTGAKLDLDLLAGLPSAPPGTVRIGLPATLARWKGQEVFLQALAKLPPELPIRGYIIGGALYQTKGSQYSIDELKQRADELGLNGRVGFTGYVDKPEAALRALDVIVHASTQPEPFGRVIAEAMACGRPVIASQAGGAMELVEDGNNSMGHCPGDAVKLSACMQRLAADSNLRQRLSIAGCATAKERFDRTQLAQSMIPIYQNLPNENPRI